VYDADDPCHQGREQGIAEMRIHEVDTLGVQRGIEQVLDARHIEPAIF